MSETVSIYDSRRNHPCDSGKFRSRFLQLIAEKSMTQTDVATAIKIRNATVDRWINHSGIPIVPVAIDLCKLFDCSLDYLFGLSDQRKIETEREGSWKLVRGSLMCTKCGTFINDSQVWKYTYCPKCGRKNKG